MKKILTILALFVLMTTMVFATDLQVIHNALSTPNGWGAMTNGTTTYFVPTEDRYVEKIYLRLNVDDPLQNTLDGYFELYNTNTSTLLASTRIYTDKDDLDDADATGGNITFTNYAQLLTGDVYTIVFRATDTLYNESQQWRLASDINTISSWTVGNALPTPTKTVISMFFGYICPEDWQPFYTACDVTDEMILYYEDANACGTFDDLPLDNSTVESCNYCTSTYVETSLDCVAGDSERDITYGYTNTCCADTGLLSDCNKPADTTESCIGIHTSSDVPNVVIDFGVEYGREMIGLAGLFVLAGLFFVGMKYWKKNK